MQEINPLIRYGYRGVLLPGAGCECSSAGRPGCDHAGQSVETVRQNKEDCELLAERANMIRDLLRRVQASKVIEDPDMWKPTEGLKSTLRRAGALVKSCQEEWSYAYRFCKGRRIARELRKVLKDLKFYILLLIGMITIINHDQNTRYYRIPETDIVKPQVRTSIPTISP